MIPVRVQKGDLLAGKYRIDGVIGEGAMGVVVSAWHIDLEQRVAIKFLHPVLAEREDAVERFLREARAVVRIESEHVARVLDVGRLEGAEPYLVMEYLDGQDLAATLQHRGALSVIEAVSYLQQACEAIAEAHASGIVHRDLKPANLFLVDRGADGPLIKVLDFGISKSAATAKDALLTNTTVIMGSPLYMSPEQLRSSRDVDERADIWALGVILFEMLTGREPFAAATLPQLCTTILEGTPTAPRSLRADLPRALEAVVLRCLEKAPSARFASVAELSLALVPFGSDLALASAERAARSLRRTGPGQKSSVLPTASTPTMLDVRPRRRYGLIAAFAAAAVVSSLLLIRSCTGPGAGSRVSANAGPTKPVLARPAGTVESLAPTPIDTPRAVAATLEPVGSAPAARRPPVSLPARRVSQGSAFHAGVASPAVKSVATPLGAVSAPTPAPVEPHADNFGGRD